MATRGPDASAPGALAGLRALRWVLVSGMTVAAWACASATVGDIGKHPDAGPDANGAGGNAGSGGSQGGSGGSGGTGGTSTAAACDPFTNSGCASDKKCTALRSGSDLVLGCGSKGSGAEGDSCQPVLSGSSQTGDDCGEGLACFALSGEPSATCRRICPITGSANACPAGSLCNLGVPGLTDFAFCRTATTCLPLEQTGCLSGQSCYFASSGAQCAPTGTNAPGAGCNQANDCVGGSTCLVIGASGVCSAFCSTASGGTPSCTGADTGGSTCAALGGSSDEANLGSCR